MDVIGTAIARLRRERGMTQEALAEVIGVSPQTVSKWETAVSCPDVALLPVLAEVFGVSIDALFGREDAGCAIRPEEAYTHLIGQVKRTIAGTVWEPGSDGPFAAALGQYERAMAADSERRSVIQGDGEVIYFREQIGVMALKRPEQGWSTLFAAPENAEVLRLLADETFRRAMQVIISRRMLCFTLPTLARAAGAADEAVLAARLEESGLFARRELMIDEAPLTYWELTGGESRLHLLYAVLTFAQELASYKSNHYCFIGDSRSYTP